MAKKKRKAYEKFYDKKIFQIHHDDLYEKYGINEFGHIFEFNDGDLIPLDPEYDEINKKVLITLDGAEYDVRQLTVITFYGYLPNTKILYKNSWRDCSRDNLYYDISSLKIIDENTIDINNNIFKRFRDTYIFMNENGVGYTISKQRICRLTPKVHGYWVVNYGKNSSKGVHSANWEAHNGPVPEGYHVHHKTHLRWHNELWNIDCIPELENIQESKVFNNQNALSDEVCIQIYKLRSEGKLIREISDITGVKANTVSNVFYGKCRKSLYDKYKDIYPCLVVQRYSEDDIEKAFKMRSEGVDFKTISEAVNIRQVYITAILQGCCRKDLFEKFIKKYPYKLNKDIFKERNEKVVSAIISGKGFKYIESEYKMSKYEVIKLVTGQIHKYVLEEHPELKDIKIPD